MSSPDPLSPALAKTELDKEERNKKQKRSIIIKLLVPPIAGAVFAVLHHFFYHFLQNRQTDLLQLTFRDRQLLKPEWAITIGNALAIIVKTCFSLSIGVVFVQRFWHLILDHKEGLTLEKMDAMFASEKGPYTLTVWREATGLAFLAALSLAMSTMAIFPPAALTSTTRPVLLKQCNIFTPDFRNVSLGIGDTPSPALQALAYRTLEADSYVPPPTSPCDICTYTVSYSAPVLSCSKPTTHPFPPETQDQVLLWDSVFFPNGTGYVWSREGDFSTEKYSAPEVLFCTALNATYHTLVQHGNGTNVTANLDQIKPYDIGSSSEEIASEILAFNTIVLAFSVAIQGTLEVVGQGTNRSLVPATLVSSSPLGTLTGTTWKLNTGLNSTISGLMKNISLGLLAGDVSAEDSSSLTSVPNGSCSRETVLYTYKQIRLLVVYSAGLLVTTICVILGIVSVVRHGGRTTEFSQLADTIFKSEINGTVLIKKEIDLRPDTTFRAIISPKQASSPRE